MQGAAQTLNTYGIHAAADLHLGIVYNGLVVLTDWLNTFDPSVTSDDPTNPCFFSAYF